MNKTAARLLWPPIAANATWVIECEKIGAEWKKLMDSDNTADVSTKGKGFSSALGSRLAPWDRKPGSEGLQKRIEEIKKLVWGQVNNGSEESMEGLNAKIEEYKKQARERKEKAKEDGEYLDETRDMVNEKMKEVKGDEKKLSKARIAYPKVVERVK
ncbi:hypothetical protein J3R83DRAFT_1346 [Lanmaoa asiatica]|nr:hypothetical protein J3R83DRAFT_1346 [Lanmaoa asiatica]